MCLRYWNYCYLWSLDSKSLICWISSFHFVNGVWNAGRIFWQLGVNNNHWGLCLYESQSKFCFICWIVHPRKSNYSHMWFLVIDIFLPRMNNAIYFKCVTFTYCAKLSRKVVWSIRKTWQSFIGFFNLSLKQNTL